MSEFTSQTTYFEKPGKENTDRVFELARARALQLGIKTLLVATTSGETGALAARYFQGFKVLVVTHSTGFQEVNQQELTPEYRAAIEADHAEILTCQHAFGGVGRAVRKKLGTFELDEIVAYTLRIFGQGMKVVPEIALMAADAGRVRTDEPVLVIAGTGHGADTACIVLPANAQDFFNFRLLELICIPAPHHPTFQK